jgi:hypothetical protein
MPKSKPYETRVLAFVDVLGWSRLIEHSESDPNVLEELDGVAASLGVSEWLGKEFFEKLPEDDMREIHGEQFSDTFVISGPATPRSARAVVGAVLIIADQISEAACPDRFGWNEVPKPRPISRLHSVGGHRDLSRTSESRADSTERRSGQSELGRKTYLDETFLGDDGTRSEEDAARVPAT